MLRAEAPVFVPLQALHQETPWWYSLAGECCPISLVPLENLQREPFGLLSSPIDGSSPTSEDIEVSQGHSILEGVWGGAAYV